MKQLRHLFKIHLFAGVSSLFVYASAQTTLTGNIGTSTLTVANKNLMGFNLGDFSNNYDLSDPNKNICIMDLKNGGTGNSFANYTGLVEGAGLGNNVMYRFYTGEFGNCYNRWYGGSGSSYLTNTGGMVFSPYAYTFHQIQYNQYNTNLNATARDALYQNYITYNDTPSISYQTIDPAQPKNNIVFPFIKLVTNNKSKNAKSVFNLPITAHYRNYTKNIPFSEQTNTWAKNVGVNSAYADTYAPRKETFAKTAVIATINSMATLNNAVSNTIPTPSNKISPQFKGLVLQNLAGFLTLIQNNVKVVNVELGNEIYSRNVNTGFCLFNNPISPTYPEFQDKQGDNTFNDKVFYLDPCNNNSSTSTLVQSGNVYGNLCKMYMALIRESVNILWVNETDPIKKSFYAEIKDNLKFGVPVSGGFPNATGGTNGLYKIDQFLYTNKSSIGFDAFVHHPYYKPRVYGGNLDLKYDSLRSYYVDRFNTFYKQTYPNLLQTNYPNLSELWFTEWAHEDPNDINNTLLEGMNYIDEFLNFLDLNSNLNLTSTFSKKDILKLANHHTLWDHQYSKKQLIDLSYGSEVKYRTMFYANKLLLPIMDNSNVGMVNALNGGFNNISPNLYFRCFASGGSGMSVPGMPGYVFVNTVYIYYSNKNFVDYTFNLQNTVQEYLNSILPTAVYSVTNSQIYADKLYASRGLGPNATTETITTDLTKTVQVDDNIPFLSSNWGALPVRRYSTGYYKVEIIRQTNGGSGSGRFKESTGIIVGSSIYPNPVKEGGTLNLSFNSDVDKEINIRVLNIAGQQMKKITIGVKKGENSLKIDVGNMSKGTYILECLGQEINYKFIIQ